MRFLKVCNDSDSVMIEVDKNDLHFGMIQVRSEPRGILSDMLTDPSRNNGDAKTLKA